MSDPQLCIVSAVQTRRVLFACGIVFLVAWSLFGNYGASYGYKSSNKILTRQLLSLDDADDLQETFDPNSTNEGVECSSIHDYNQSVYCEFVSNVPSCGGDDGLVPYFKFVYCKMPYKLIPLSMLILIVWLLYLFMFLGTTAESFFCRELAYITQLLKLSPNVAGVTLLAIGNGAPDIFSAITAFNHTDAKKSSLAFGALFGAGMFVTNIVVGMVCIFHPFRVTRRPFLRDNIYYVFAIFWIFYLLWDNEMSVRHAIGLLVYYISYVLLVLLGSFIYQKWNKWQQQKLAEENTRVKYEKRQNLTKSQSDKVTISESDSSDDDGDRDKQPKVKVHAVVHGARDILPVVVVSKVEDSGSSDESRPRTPSEKSALKATNVVYGASKDGRRSRSRSPFNPETDDIGELPRPRSRLEQVLDNAAHIAEDVIASSNPNLAKLWQNEYDKEMKREQGSRTTTPYSSFAGTTPTPSNVKETSFLKKDVNEEDQEDDKDDRILTENTPLLSDKENVIETVHPFRKLIEALFPFITSNYKSSSIFSKIFQIIKYPLTFILTITIPVIDVDEPLNNWNKWLTVLQCVITPVFISVGTGFGLIKIGGIFPVVIIVFVVSIGLLILVAVTSSSDKPPIYHCVLAWIGFAVSVIWIYLIADEIVNVLQVFGVVVKLSDGILGITLLAWGNSIQDSVTNVTMARQGYPRMAVGACFGGPLLNLLIGIGLASIIRSINNGENQFEIYLTQVTMLAALFLIASLCISLVGISILRFQMYRFYGVFLFVFYISFIIVVILAELKVFQIKIEGVLSIFD